MAKQVVHKSPNGNGRGAGNKTGKKVAKKTFDVGLAQKSKEIKKAKTHKGRKIMESRAPKVVENQKTAIIMKGNKSSNVVNQIMKELNILRGQEEKSRLFVRKSHDIHPFENQGPLEIFASKQDCSLIIFGNHQKKRPDNLILGRIYDKRVLDMFEFGVSNFKSMEEFAVKEVSRELKPILIFQGEQFEFSEKHQRAKNLFYELFHMNTLEEANIVEMKRALVFTSTDDTTIQVRQYEIPQITEPQVMKSQLDLVEIGPRFDLKLRRNQVASMDLYKIACKKPKVLNPDKKRFKKNVYTTEIGDKRAKVFIQQQDLDILATRKFKKQKPQKIQAEDDYGSIQDDCDSNDGSLLTGQFSQRNSLIGGVSDISKTDLYPKTGFTLTTANIVKSFVGLGILAAPYGFMEVGYLPATILILTNATLNFYTVHLQTKAKEHYGRKVKTFSDLGEACFGKWGRVATALNIVIGQFFCCSGYVMFFIQQIDQVIKYTTGDMTSDNRFLIFMLSFLILAPLSTFESMKQVSYISITAIISISIALCYIILTDISEINYPSFDKTLNYVNLSGIPYFFGIAMFMFEGNVVAVEIHNQMEEAPKRFTQSLGNALAITATLILIVGTLSYSAFGQFTKSIILLNLKPSLMTYVVQIFYSIGILCSYCLQIIPTFKIMNLIPVYKNIPESRTYPWMKSFLTRIAVAFICCTFALVIPNLGQFLNFQGAIGGCLVTFIFPIAFYFKTFGIDKIPNRERYLCYAGLTYGTIGGLWSAYYSLHAMFNKQ
eukprot:403339927